MKIAVLIFYSHFQNIILKTPLWRQLFLALKPISGPWTGPTEPGINIRSSLPLPSQHVITTHYPTSISEAYAQML